VKISIIIPAYNEEKLLAGTLNEIASASAMFSQQSWEHELIVCDNNSTDRTAEIARKAGAIVVFEPVNQIGRARNRGAAEATGDWLLFIDADSHPSPALFGEMLTAIARRDCLAGGCTLTMPTADRGARWVVGIWNLYSRLSRSLAGSFIFCEANVFRELGGFSLALFASEEIEFSKRLRKRVRAAGKNVVILHRFPLLTSARKLHLYSRRDYLRFFLRTARARGRTLNSAEECHIWYDGRR
jgi:glycosyltransferase involved in cell wall biosynthesis